MSEGHAEAIRVYILDDHEIVRRGLRDLLEDEGMLVLGESHSAQEATRRIPALRPDVAVLDGRLGDGTGIEVCRHVRSIDPRIRCLILTAHQDEDAIRSAVLAGASGYLLKRIALHSLAEAIRRAAGGETLFDPEVLQRAVSAPAAPVAEDPRFEGLSPQQRRVLELIGSGMSNRQIAHELHLSEKTVKNYVSSLLSKLGLERRTQAAVYIAHPHPDRLSKRAG
jgi:DNA-binding NarL/FixJ family response regulator